MSLKEWLFKLQTHSPKAADNNVLKKYSNFTENKLHHACFNTNLQIIFQTNIYENNTKQILLIVLLMVGFFMLRQSTDLNLKWRLKWLKWFYLYCCQDRGGSRDFEKAMALYFEPNGCPTKKTLGFRWSKKAKITLETISFWRNISISIFKFSSFLYTMKAYQWNFILVMNITQKQIYFTDKMLMLY